MQPRDHRHLGVGLLLRRPHQRARSLRRCWAISQLIPHDGHAVDDDARPAVSRSPCQSWARRKLVPTAAVRHTRLMTNTLVTGGMGFIGSHTAAALLDLGHSCVLTRHRTARAPDFLADEIGRRIVVEQLDISDQDALLALGDRHAITGIVHLADPGLTGWADSRPAAATVLGDLRAGTRTLLGVLEAAAAWEVTRVMVASTIGVYGGLPDLRGLREDAPLPIGSGGNPIAASKKLVELLCSSFAERTGAEIVTARIGGVWGPLGHPRSRFGAAPSLVHAAVAGGPSEPAGEAAPYAEDAIDLLYVKDCARAIALLQTAAQLRHSTYNVGSGRATTNREVAHAIEQVIPGATVTLQPGRNPSGAGQDIYLDTTRLREETGFRPEFQLERAVADYVAWLRAGHER